MSTDRTVRTWLNEAVETAAADGVTFSVPVTPHTFRHSYAMHMLYAGIPLKVLQSLMGHKSISSTEVYTKVFALDVAARHRVQFQMPAAEAVAMLKGHGGDGLMPECPPRQACSPPGEVKSGGYVWSQVLPSLLAFGKRINSYIPEQYR